MTDASTAEAASAANEALSPAEAVFADLAGHSLSTREKGDRLERFAKRFFQTAMPYADLFDQVWLWSEWPDRWGSDIGIDLVAREAGTDRYWAIQCKFYAPVQTLPKEGVEAFLAASGRHFTTNEGELRRFDERLIVSTTNRWSSQARRIIENQEPRVNVLGVEQFDESNIDWRRFYWDRPETLPTGPLKSLRNHQKEALDAVVDGLSEADRGQMIMACGTGKTFTALRIAENQRLVPDGGSVLVLVPSLALVGQTLREWAAQTERGFHAFTVCSDQQVSKDNDDITTRDLAYPATTDPAVLADRVAAVTAAEPNKPTVVLSTYQSVQAVCDAQSRHGLDRFDLVICDEAHRTAGISLSGQGVTQESEFTKPLSERFLAARKRLFMTATPRIYAAQSQDKADEAGATLYSMDDPVFFGEVLYQLNFGEAVDRGLLSDYRVLIVAVDSGILGETANSYNSTYRLDDRTGISAEFATRLIGTWKGLTKQDAVTLDDAGNEIPLAEDTGPMRRAVAFTNSIKSSKEIRDTLQALVGHVYEESGGELPGGMHCNIRHVDGSMHAGMRHESLQWLRGEPEEGECRVLTNARCLSEGVDVPALDGVVFFDTRDSVVEIAQSVGRVMRKAPGKEYGYIVLPVEIPREETSDYARFIERDNRFKGIWKVLRSLRAHDERLVDEAEFRKKIRIIDGNGGRKKGGDGSDDSDVQTTLDLSDVPIGDISEAVYGLIPKKLGDREYWASWAREVADMARRLIDRIRAILDEPDGREAFDRFLKDVRTSVSPSVTENDAVQMLAQHIITRPVFEALFGSTGFAETNPVAAALDHVQDRFAAYGLDEETAKLDRFYKQVTERIHYARSDKSRQDVIRNLYDTFFQTAFPDVANRLGIVYTPTPIVDFINRSADRVLHDHFGQTLSDEGVHIIDPFVGTGTFLVRMIQEGLIDAKALPRKMEHELHANEIVLLAYYIATVNVETAFHEMTGKTQPFEGAVFTDTFAMTEGAQRDYVDEEQWLADNNERARRQRASEIHVIVGNPPYSEGNENISYPNLDAKIKNTYVRYSSSTTRNNLYDSYIRAIRWASDRIGDRGLIAFVTNGSFIDGNAADGLRQSLVEEFSTLYIMNLRGDAYTSGEQRRKEGGGVFGEGSRAPIAITVLVKSPKSTEQGAIFYYDIGDYLDRETKLARLDSIADITIAATDRIIPTDDGEWINQGSSDFYNFCPLSDEDDHASGIIKKRSNGIISNKDAWFFNFSRERIEFNVGNLISRYNSEVDSIHEKGNITTVAGVKEAVNTDPKYIGWHQKLFQDALKGKKKHFDYKDIRLTLYRPFTKEYTCFSKQLFHSLYKYPTFIPTKAHRNFVLVATGPGASTDFSVLVTDLVPERGAVALGQCFPRYYYEFTGEKSSRGNGLFNNPDQEPDAAGFVRHDAVTDWALNTFRQHYDDDTITKDAIFWYIYGVLHADDYRERFRNNLRRGLPRIPLTQDFWAFSRAGEELSYWHLNYETLDPYPLEESVRGDCERDPSVHDKMRFPGKRGHEDKSAVVVNPTLTLRGIPAEAYDYRVNGKSPVEWIMERYQVWTDKKTGIHFDANEASDDPDYIVNLIKRVVQVSLETRRIVQELPPIEIGDQSDTS